MDDHVPEMVLSDGTRAVNLGRGTVASVRDGKVGWLTGSTTPGGYPGWVRGSSVVYWNGAQLPQIIASEGTGATGPAVADGKVYFFSGAYMSPSYLNVWNGTTLKHEIGGMYALPSALQPMAVHGDQVAFVDGFGTIQLWDGVTQRQLSGGSGSRSNPVFFNDEIVWASLASSDGFSGYNLYASDGMTRRRLLHFAAQVHLSISASSGLLAYSQWDGNDYEVFVWNGTESTRLTDNLYDDLYPSLDGDQVAWQGWDGQDWEIFLASGLSTLQ